MTASPGAHFSAALDREIDPAVRQFAAMLAREADALAVLFYGSNLRTGSLEGVLDFYVLLPGAAERGIWPRVSYREWTPAREELAREEHTSDEAGQQGDQGESAPDTLLRAKIATMTLATFEKAAAGETIDTTIWSRFVQPCALAWCRGEAERERVAAALRSAAVTAARLAVALGPPQGDERAYWRALFRATYRAELRVEKPGREEPILDANAAHFTGLLPAALASAGIAVQRKGDLLRPDLSASERRRIARWWRRRRRMGKPLNVIRLLRATGTFAGAARYAAWKIERHTGIAVPMTPWRERHPLLAAPCVLWSIRRLRRSANHNGPAPRA